MAVRTDDLICSPKLISGQDDEGGLSGELGDDLDGQGQTGGGPVDELAGVAGVGPDHGDCGKAGA
jgi:hypothetical protein